MCGACKAACVAGQGAAKKIHAHAHERAGYLRAAGILVCGACHRKRTIAVVVVVVVFLPKKLPNCELPCGSEARVVVSALCVVSQCSWYGLSSSTQASPSNSDAALR